MFLENQSIPTGPTPDTAALQASLFANAAAGPAPTDEVTANPGLIKGYQPPGPVAAAYLHSSKEVTGIMGPVAGGKTVASVVKGLIATMRQPRAVHDSVRHCKITAVCDTYGNLWDKLLPSFHDVFPKEWGNFEGSRNNRADMHIYLNDVGGSGPLHMHWAFRAVGDVAALDSFIGGLQPTCVYLYEATYLPAGALSNLAQRLGRWPPPSWFKEGDFPWSAIWADFNAPNETHELYKRLALAPTPQDELFVQPSGFDPDAENLAALHKIHPDYYRDRAEKMADPAIIARMIENKPGYDRSGKPVFATYRDHIHSPSSPLKHVPGRLLVIGLDGGLLAGAIYMQADPKENHRIAVLGETVTEPGTTNSAAEFGRLVKTRVNTDFPGSPVVVVYDPALTQTVSAVSNSDKAEKISWMSEFIKATGFAAIPAPSFRWNDRFTAVNNRLSRLHDGRPLLEVDRRCTILREGFLTGYRFRRISSGNDVGYSERPDKTGAHRKFTEPHDALQNGVMALDGDNENLNRALMKAVDRMQNRPDASRRPTVKVRNQ